jgi:hypothetical protein
MSIMRPLTNRGAPASSRIAVETAWIHLGHFHGGIEAQPQALGQIPDDAERDGQIPLGQNAMFNFSSLGDVPGDLGTPDDILLAAFSHETSAFHCRRGRTGGRREVIRRPSS